MAGPLEWNTMTAANDLPLETITALMESLNCGALLVDRAGVIFHANTRACELLARTRTAVEGLSIESFYGEPADIEFVRQRVEQFDSIFEDDFFLPRPDGTRLPVIVSSRPLGDINVSVGLYKVITFIDIGRQKRLEHRLTEDYRQIAKLSDTVIEQAIELKHHSDRLEQAVRERTTDLREANMEAIYMLAVASEAKDADTGAHVLRIREYTELLAGEMGLPQLTAERCG
ncbi:MAG: PAS domain-containing protein [Planctomycetes bacterium]|nr:PAS domain-containing protein [Planctomycetota bacterium]